MSWSVGTDTGGTFTDLVAVDEEGRVRVAKTPSTPPDFERGVVDALATAGLDPGEIRALYHGTTVTTNALLERRGARTGLLATEGFRDTLQIRDGSREEFYKVNWDPPRPLVDRPDRIGITERVDVAGTVLKALDEDQVRAAAKRLARKGVEAVAIVFLHSYANDAHEQRAREILEEELPDVFHCASADVLPEPPEFERTSTTVANAYVGPVLKRYVAKLEEAVRGLGYEGSVLIMHSGGGNMTPANALTVPIRTATSGPAAGVMAAAAIARTTGHAHAVSLDMGGTSADIATIHDGQPRMTVEQTIEWGMPIGFPSVDLIAIGAGGGSIAGIDDAGAPHVGPRSAGSQPGPACYGRGGTEPTVCDANVVLGRLRARSLLGGEMELDLELARKAVGNFAHALGIGVEEAALGIVRIANEHMANGIRRATIKRGLDPREFSLIAFGGAGPMHAAEIASELQVPEVVIPPHPGATSALGLVAVDARHDLLRSLIANQADLDPGAVDALFAELEDDGRELLAREGFAPEEMVLQRSLDVRYAGQVRALTLPIEAGEFDADALARMIDQFHDGYRAEFKFAVPELPIETRSVRVSAVGIAAKPNFDRAEATDRDGPAASTAEQEVAFAGSADRTAAVYDRATLTVGDRLDGPAIIEQYDSTTVVPPGALLEVDAALNLIIRFEQRED